MSPSLILFLVVLLLNVIPAFAPPTWMVFSYLGFRYPHHSAWLLALIGASAAALGRFLLAKMSRIIVRNHWLSEAARTNVDAIRMELVKHPRLTFGGFLFYALTPLPSNYLFIAYGLTALPIVRIVLPFLAGRFLSYVLWAHSAAAISARLDVEDTEALGYLSVYFIVTQLFLLSIVYAFTRVDWRSLLQEHKCKWLPKS